MTNFDYQAEFGYSADELRAAVLEVSEASKTPKRVVWRVFLGAAGKSIEALRMYYAGAVEHERLMDAGRALFVEEVEEAEEV
jgi:hypothetical protein